MIRPHKIEAMKRIELELDCLNMDELAEAGRMVRVARVKLCGCNRKRCKSSSITMTHGYGN